MSSAPLNYRSIESAMVNTIERMEELTQVFARLADELSGAETTYKIEFARKRYTLRTSVDARGKKYTVDIAEDMATEATKDQLIAYESTKAKYDSCRQALSTVRAQLEGYRSLMASHREAGG
jgi:hypothetical protein